MYKFVTGTRPEVVKKLDEIEQWHKVEICAMSNMNFSGLRDVAMGTNFAVLIHVEHKCGRPECRFCYGENHATNSDIK
jgi:hypothetical protein